MAEVGRVELIETLEQLDTELPCDFAGCVDPVTWEGNLRCCAFPAFACDVHHRFTVEYEANPPRGFLTCEHCLHVTLGIAWRPYVRGGRRG